MSKKIGTGCNEVVGLLEVNRRIEVAVSSFPHYSNDKKLRRRKRRKRNGRKEEEEEAEGGKKKRMRWPSPLSATDSLRSLHAGLASPDGTAPTGWRQIKRKRKNKKKKVKTGIRRLLGEKKEKRPGGTAGQRGSSSRRTVGGCWGVRSFGSTPSNIIYAPIIFPHVHTHERVYTYG